MFSFRRLLCQAFPKPLFWEKNYGLDAGPNFSIVTVDGPCLRKMAKLDLLEKPVVEEGKGE